jgi:hypothetical protein
MQVNIRHQVQNVYLKNPQRKKSGSILPNNVVSKELLQQSSGCVHSTRYHPIMLKQSISYPSMLSDARHVSFHKDLLCPKIVTSSFTVVLFCTFSGFALLNVS